MNLATFLVSCAERERDRQATLADLARTDWGQTPVVVLDDGQGRTRLERITRTWRRALEQAAYCGRELVLLLEDDVRFDRHIRKKLEAFAPLRDRGRYLFASLYDNSHPLFHARSGPGWATGPSEFFWGLQAVVTTPETARAILARWDTVQVAYPDERVGRLASALTEIVYVRPGLVRHVGASTWNPIRRLLAYPEG